MRVISAKMSLYPPIPDGDLEDECSKLQEQPHSLLPACSVCLDDFTEKRLPKYLSCHHTFCKECIQQLLKYGMVHCPLCRKPTNVTSVDSLQTNNDVLTMAEYGNVFVNLWCYDCHDTPRASCLMHRVRNRSAGSQPTLGQQVDNTVEAWTPTVMRVVETTQGWVILATDATYSAVTKVSDFVAPVTSYVIDWLMSVVDVITSDQ